MKILIYTAVWKRPEITEICFMSIARLRVTSKHDVKAFAVISEIEAIPLCEKYGIDWICTENSPLGEKKNYGLRIAMQRHDFDYMVEIGSDDLLKNEFFDVYPWDRDIMMLSQIYFLNSETGGCRLFTARAAKIGAGRAISRKALEKCAPIWHSNQGRGLDGFSTMHLSWRGFLPKTFTAAKPVAIDIKSAMNIWSYAAVQKIGKQVGLTEVIEGLSEGEIKAIECLLHGQTSARWTGR
jgi:hypothetical protein